MISRSSSRSPPGCAGGSACDVTFLHLYWPIEEYERLGLRGARDPLAPDPEVVKNLEPKLRARVGALPGHGQVTRARPARLGRSGRQSAAGPRRGLVRHADRGRPSAPRSVARAERVGGGARRPSRGGHADRVRPDDRIRTRVRRSGAGDSPHPDRAGADGSVRRSATRRFPTPTRCSAQRAASSSSATCTSTDCRIRPTRTTSRTA